MSKWSQEQRDAACIELSKWISMSDPNKLSESGFGYLIELACQRNELLEALKLLIEDSRFQVSIGGNPNAVDKAYAQCLRAISKAEQP